MSPVPVSRRWVLRSAGAAGIVGSLGAIATADRQVWMLFNEQRSDGTSIVIEEIEVDLEAVLVIYGADGQIVAGEHVREDLRFSPGEATHQHEIPLDETLASSQEITIGVYEYDSGEEVRSESATVTLEGEETEVVDGQEPRRIDAQPDRGFNYPYYVYVPDLPVDDARPLLVDPVNTGQPSDDLDVHLESAQSKVSASHSPTRQIAQELQVPLVVPVFPRPQSEPVDSDHYVHALDDSTLSIESGTLERVDLQMLAMIEDAQERLADADYELRTDGVVLNGFSAAGTYVERFTALHPDEVLSVSAGGINGMVILPTSEARGEALPYHIGVADFEELVGEPFDPAAYADVGKYFYLGDLDGNDTIPFDDAWTSEEARQLALEVYGRDLHNDRFPFCRAVHEDEGADTVFRYYQDVGHDPRAASEDIVTFHERSLAGDSPEEIRPMLDGYPVPHLHAHVSFDPISPAPGEQVAFDASRSSVDEQSIVEYEWDFGNGDTENGQEAHHVFETTGGHAVTLTTTDDAGESYSSTQFVTVREPTPTSIEIQGGSNADTGGTPDESLPGFGIVGALGAMATGGYLLHRDRTED